MEVGGINLKWGAFYREIALSAFNKDIKKHCVKHSWASQPMPDGEGRPWKSLMLRQ